MSCVHSNLTFLWFLHPLLSLYLVVTLPNSYSNTGCYNSYHINNRIRNIPLIFPNSTEENAEIPYQQLQNSFDCLLQMFCDQASTHMNNKSNSLSFIRTQTLKQGIERTKKGKKTKMKSHFLASFSSFLWLSFALNSRMTGTGHQ